MKRCLGLLAAGLLLAGCGGSVRIVTWFPPVHPQPLSPTAWRFSTAANRHDAHRDVQQLLRIVDLPHGARVVSSIPKSAPRSFRDYATSMPGFAIARRIWIVHAPLEQVVRFARANTHPRPRPLAQFRGKNNGLRLSRTGSGSYSFPPNPGRSWSRWLNVDIAALPGGGTAVLAQAGVAWDRTPPHSAIVPGAVRRIDVVSRVGTGPPAVLVHTQDRTNVRWIVARTNALGLVNPHVFCAGGTFGGPEVTLRFRGADGQILARAHVRDIAGSGNSGPCNPLYLSVDGRAPVALNGADLLRSIDSMLGIDVAPPRPADVSRCLTRHHWTTRPAGSTLTAAHAGHRWTVTFHRTGKVTTAAHPPRALARCLRTGPPIVYYG